VEEEVNMRVRAPYRPAFLVVVAALWLCCASATRADTPTPAPTVTPPDHFQCYEAHAPRHTIPNVSLLDAVGPSTVDLIQPHRFCAPANKDGEDPTAPTHVVHLDGFRMRQTSPRFVHVRNLAITNQFGSTVIDLVRPDYLLVPSAKSLVAPPPPLLVATVDHFKCYRARGRQRVAGTSVQDQFGSLTFDLKRPRRLCLAADKNGEGILDPGASLLCYEVRLAGGTPFVPPGKIFLTNQFGDDSFSLFRATELCVPSSLTGPAATPTPTASATPMATATAPAATPTPSPTATTGDTPTPTGTPGDATTATPTDTSTPGNAATPTPTDTSTPGNAVTPTPTDTADVPTPTATSTPPGCSFDGLLCGGDCPVPGDNCEQISDTECACVTPPPCGLDGGLCDGSCPTPTDVCLFIHAPGSPSLGTCACVPPAQACTGDGNTCNGFCPLQGDDCFPTQPTPDACECRPGIQ
jgi:hypothetical protein